MKEIVIAAYDKDLSWMDKFNDNIKQTVYRRGDYESMRPNEIKITPNLGRCVHSFFNHILTNYDNLADYTFFAQDYPFDHWENLIDVINGDKTTFTNNATLKIGGYYGYHFNTIGSMWSMPTSTQFGGGNVLCCSSNGYPQDTNPKINVDKYWDIIFDDVKPNMYEFMPGGHFGISKEQVQLRSKEFYKQIVDLLVDDETAPWMIERLECYIFNPKYKSRI